MTITTSKEGQVVPVSGLIALVSKGRGRSSVIDAAYFHQETLKHIWLISSIVSREDAVTIRSEIEGFLPSDRCTIHDDKILDDIDDIDEAMEKVKRVRDTAKKKFGIEERDLICDFTGMTKAASAGMVLACAEPGRRLQYMKPQEKDRDGQPVAGKRSLPREIEISYSVSAPD